MKIENLKRLSKKEIEARSLKVLTHFNENYFSQLKPTPLEAIVDNLVKMKHLSYDESPLGYAQDSSKILGCYISSKRLIVIDSGLRNNLTKFHFVLGHELGHFVLHRTVEILEDIDLIQDTENRIFGERRQLVSDLDYMEWQANYFSSVMLLPKDIFYNKVLKVREKLELPWRGRIYVDNQKCNRTDYYNTINLLCDYFKVSKTVVEIRLKELDLVKDNRNDDTKTIAEAFKEMLNDLSGNSN